MTNLNFAWVVDCPIPVMGWEIRFRGAMMCSEKRSVTKQHSLPESSSARPTCSVPLSSMTEMTAVASRMVDCV